MADSFTELGAAEEHVVTQITTAIANAKDAAAAMVAALEDIDIDGIRTAILDADSKKTVIAMVEPIQGLVKSLTMNQMVPLLAKVLLAPKGAE